MSEPRYSLHDEYVGAREVVVGRSRYWTVSVFRLSADCDWTGCDGVRRRYSWKVQRDVGRKLSGMGGAGEADRLAAKLRLPRVRGAWDGCPVPDSDIKELVMLKVLA